MSTGDDAQILQVPLRAEGVKADDWAKVRAGDLTTLNEVLRQMQERFFKLVGRTGDAAIRSGLTVEGSLSCGGTLSGTDLTLGVDALVPSNPSFAPTLEEALTPQAWDYTPLLGATADLRSASPFTWTLSEHFIGGEIVSGRVGELGWTTSGIISTGVNELSHPGVLNLDGTASLYLNNNLNQGDVSYLAMVVKPVSVSRINFNAGLVTAGLADTSSDGAYFFIASSTTPFWATATRGSGTLLTNTSTTPVVAEDWVLLEIVQAGGYVDFFLNRRRLFRHSGASVTSSTAVVAGFNQADVVGTANTDYDRFVITGRGSNKVWSE